MRFVILFAWLMSSVAPIFPSDSKPAEATAMLRKAVPDAALIEAARAGDARRVAEFLNDGADPNTAETLPNAGVPHATENVTVLMKAVENGDLETVKLLVERGANVNARSRARRNMETVNTIPVLMYATRFEVTELLLDAGADPRAKDDSGFTALMSQVVQGNVPAVGLLIERGADTAARDVYDKTALDYARECGSREIVSLLKRAGARR